MTTFFRFHRALSVGAFTLASISTFLFADPLTMGPTPLSSGTFTAFDASNTVTIHGQYNINYDSPPLVWTENLISGGPASQNTSHTWSNGSASQAICNTSSSLASAPTITSLTGQVVNIRQLQPNTAVDPVDTLSAYAGASMFYTFTITAAASVTMSWNTSFVYGAPSTGQVVMFWDIAGTNPAIGSVAGSNNVDSGLWTGTLAPGEYNMIYTRHDGNTNSLYTYGNTTSTFTLTVQIPAPATGALLAMFGLMTRRRAR